MEPGYMPFQMMDKQGTLMGFDVDLAHLLAERMGVRAEFIRPEKGFSTILNDLERKRFDLILSGMTITPERNLRVMFSDPYIIVGQAILANIKHKQQIRHAEDFNNTTYLIAYMKDTTGAAAVDKIFPRARRIAVATQEEGVRMVREARIDAFVYDLPAFATLMAKEGEDAFLFLDQPLTFEPLGMALHFDDFQLQNIVNNFIRQIQADGTYDTLYDRWFLQKGWFQRM
ncbi:transporter substrate-binding domain-containing protein [Desulfobotulus sp.]|uniref:transporter substrate-binding domain-containing protein n=1 Tax=Desulfobotulus sp. TaxID=1940337 RepID=UPI002A36917B|nr:transporter substrate-binding domain-containing protein [Desulfobotulus sp.]MDY0161901.1 transporter substrate-binding domain-containing protein [Desulfobotulus sp.]